MAQRVIFHVDLDAFFVSVERILNPELIGKPVLVGNAGFGRGVVSAASYEARAFGVHSALPMSIALRRCPDAIVVNGHYAKYQEYSGAFMDILRQWSPAVEAMSLDEAYLDMTGTERLYGPDPGTVALTIRRRIRDELSLPASIGVASSKVVAKVASDAAKPDGQVIVPAGEEAAFLAPLPIRALPGIGKASEALLTGAGIRTLGDLQRADVDGLRAVIGDWAAGLQGRSRGIDESVVAERGRPKSVSRETTFMQDQTDPERLRGAIEHFADRVASSLRHERLAARTVDVKLRITGFLTYTAGETLDHPTQDQRIIAETGQRLLKKLRRRHPQPVRLIGLGVSNLQEAADQLSLFTKDAERHVRLAAALDSVRDRFGFDALRPATHLRSLHPHDD